MSYFQRTQLVVIVLISVLWLVKSRASEDVLNSSSNCHIEGQITVRCSGDFNLSELLLRERDELLLELSSRKIFKPAEPSLNTEINSYIDVDYWKARFTHLQIVDTSISIIDESTMDFHGFTFATILIENAPNLRSIHPQALTGLKERLTHFRAINTSLPNYNEFGNDHQLIKQNPFEDFPLLVKVYVGPQSYCPLNESLLFPCKCEDGMLKNDIFNQFYNAPKFEIGSYTQVTCEGTNLNENDLKEIFLRISKSDHEPKHFDALTLKGTAYIQTISSEVFSNVTITSVFMGDVIGLKSVHPNAFGSENNNGVARSIQVFQIDKANFKTMTSSEVDDIFSVLSSLTNIRFLEIEQSGIPYIPAHAFTPKNSEKRLNNLRHISLSFDQKEHGSGIKSVGSYAFSGAPNLVELKLFYNYIEQFESYAFAFNQTSNRTLKIDISENPFDDTVGLKPNAFSGSQRPVHISYLKFPYNPLQFMPENVFRPFIEENSENYFEFFGFELNIWCDCGIQWMFDNNGHLKQSVQSGFRIWNYFQCKPESTFECLPNCLVFPPNGLVYCDGNRDFDVRKTFQELALFGVGNIDKLKFSSKAIRELPKGAFSDFEFKQVKFTDCSNLSSIHPEALAASTKTLTDFQARNTSLTKYPNFAIFRNLTTIRLDDVYPFHINSSNFDFSETEGSAPEKLDVHMNRGSIDHLTFTKLNNETNIILFIDENPGNWSCYPTPLKLEEKIFKPLLEANSRNKIYTACSLDCSCDLKWIYESWNTLKYQISIGFMGPWPLRPDKFYCSSSEVNLNNDFSNFGSYFYKNC